MICEAAIRRLVHYGRTQRFDEAIGPCAYERAFALAQSMECLKADDANPCLRHAWIKARRGNIDEWLTYEEYADSYWDDDGTAPTQEKWSEEWQWEFPEEVYWHLIECVAEDDYVAVVIDGRCVLRGNKESATSYDFDEHLGWLNELFCSVGEVLSQIRSGTYASLLNEELPYDFRWGVMKRKDFWAATGEDGRRFGGRLAADDAQRIAKLLKRQPDRDAMPGLRSMTMEGYFHALKGAYVAAGFSIEEPSWRGFDVDDPRAWYCRIGDCREGKLFEIDQASEEALEALMAPGVFLNHGFEVIQGRGCSRVFLAPRKGDDGLWRLFMHGHFDFHAEEMALMWEHLNNVGIPTYLHSASWLAEILLGEDWAFIAPKDEYVDYLAGSEKFGKRVGIAFHLWDEYKTELIRAAEWMPLNVPVLADSLGE